MSAEGEGGADVGEAGPIRGGGDAEPVERLGSNGGMFRRQLPKIAFADHVHKCYQNDNIKARGKGVYVAAM